MILMVLSTKRKGSEGFLIADIVNKKKNIDLHILNKSVMIKERESALEAIAPLNILNYASGYKVKLVVKEKIVIS